MWRKNRLLLIVSLLIHQTYLFSINEKNLVLELVKKSDSLEKHDVDSSMYYALEALNLSKEINYVLGVAESTGQIGDVYVIQNQLPLALSYYQEAEKYFLSEKNYYEYCQILMVIGNIYATQNKVKDAIKVYQKAISLAERKIYLGLLGHLYNNSGTVYKYIDDIDLAQKFFLKAINSFDEVGLINEKANALINYSEIEWQKGNEEIALKNYFEAIRIFSSNDNWIQITNTYLMMATNYIENQNYEKGEHYKKLAIESFKIDDKQYKGPSLLFDKRIYLLNANIAFHKNQFKETINQARKSFMISKTMGDNKTLFLSADYLSKSFEYLGQKDSAFFYYKVYMKGKSEYLNQNNVKEIIKLKLEAEYESKIKDQKLANLKRTTEYEKKEFFFLSVSIGLSLLVLLGLFYFLNQRSKAKNAVLKQEKLRLEKNNLYSQIQFKNRELTMNMMYLLQKNEFINSVSKKLVELKETSLKQNQPVLQDLIRSLKQNTNTKIWEDFEVRFTEVHVEFMNALNEKHPDLSPNERKLCAFLRLNMTTKEISAITQQSVKSINVARFRLRKKINLDRDENLISYLVNI
jgi:tetratricopeptide (TPR) repeat protein/DNA-binding CsgD family transcriptional regulator